MKAVTRTLEKAGKQFVVAWADKQVTTTSGGKPATTTHPSTPAAATALCDQLRAKLKAGYKPAPGAIKPVIKALRNAVGWYEVVNAFSDDELPEVYAAIAADTPKPMMREVCAAFRRRPSDAALPYLLKLTKDPTGDDIQQLVKAFEFAAKAPGVAAWLQRSLAASVAKLPNERARTLLGRMLARLARGPKLAPTAPAPAAKGSDEADLLAAIAAAPADDGPRQVYADWLIDRGNHWGEVITLALRVARMPDDAKQTEAYVALRRLEAKHAKQFLEPIRPFIRTWQFERGMISYVTCDAQLFAQAGASIADRAPRGVLNLTGLKPKGLAALVASPLGRFERVSLSSNRLDDAAIAQLVGSPSIAGVAELDVGHNVFADAGYRAIAESPHLRSLVWLQSTGFSSSPRCSVDALGALLRSKQLPKLRVLEIGVTGAGVGAALAGTKLPLKTIELQADRFDDDDALAIASSKALAGVKRFHVNSPTQLTDRGALALLGSRTVRLESLLLDSPALSAAVRARIEG